MFPKSIPLGENKPVFVCIDNEYINRHHVITITLSEWEDDDGERPELPYRLQLSMIDGSEKEYHIEELEFAKDLVNKFNGIEPHSHSHE